jgi:hypothetical protein
MKLTNKSQLFSEENIQRIEQLRDATYVCDTEHKDIPVAVFYGKTAHPVSGSRYFALYRADTIMITDGSFIEDQEITGAVAEDGEVVFSRSRHDFVTSSDGSVFIDGGRAYTKTNTGNLVTLLVRDGVLRILEDMQ